MGHQTIQRKTPWVDSTCADCPGFLVLGAAPSTASTVRLGASDCSPGLAFCFLAPWAFPWICCPQLPYRPFENGTHSTCFYSTGGYHTTIAPDVAKFSFAQMCLCETKCQGSLSHHLGELLTSLKKYRATWGIAAIVLQKPWPSTE